jgi:NADH-quinone oxidoreductase subunit L
MADLVILIPLMPLLGFLILVCSLGRLPKWLAGLVGTGSIAASLLLVTLVALEYNSSTTPLLVPVYTWLKVAGLTAEVSFLIDGLSLTMLFVITGVGLLIHIYSTLFMWQEPDFSRFFSYMNLFVFAMLVLVMADNLLLLFVGWEGVGLCS